MLFMAPSIVKGGFRAFGGDNNSGTEALFTNFFFLDFFLSSFVLVPSSDSPASPPEELPDSF